MLIFQKYKIDVEWFKSKSKKLIIWTELEKYNASVLLITYNYQEVLDMQWINYNYTYELTDINDQGLNSVRDTIIIQYLFLYSQEKVIKIKISKFTLKLTNLRKLEKKDYAVFLVATILFMTIILFIVYIPCVLLLLYFCPSSVIFVLFYYIWIYFDFQELDKEIKPSTLVFKVYYLWRTQ